MKVDKNFSIPAPVKGKVTGKMSEKYANICGVISSLAWPIFAIGAAIAMIIAALRF